MSESSAVWGEVVVQRTTDGVEIGPAVGFTTDSTESSEVPLLGGALYVDITNLDAPPRVLIDDTEWAQVWLPDLFGDGVAAAVAGDAPSAAVTAHHGYLSEALVRTGLGYWLHRWWPSGAPGIPEIDQSLLELELAGLTWQSEAALWDSELTIRLVDRNIERLQTLAEAVSETNGLSAYETAQRAVVRALRAAVAYRSSADPFTDEARAMLGEISRQNRAFAELARNVDPDSWLESLVNEHVSAKPHILVRSKGGAAAPAGSRSGGFSADDAQLPPRTLRSADDNVRWRLEPADDGGQFLTVEALAAPALASDPQLYARALVDNETTVVPLTLDTETARLRGNAHLDSVSADLAIDITSVSHGLEPRWEASDSSRATDERQRRLELIQSRQTDVGNFGHPFIAERVAWRIAQ